MLAVSECVLRPAVNSMARRRRVSSGDAFLDLVKNANRRLCDARCSFDADPNCIANCIRRCSSDAVAMQFCDAVLRCSLHSELHRRMQFGPLMQFSASPLGLPWYHGTWYLGSVLTDLYCSEAPAAATESLDGGLSSSEVPTPTFQVSPRLPL